MLRPVPHLLALLALTAAPATTQVTATYAAFGTGCPGTGIGLGSHHVVPAPYGTSFGGSDNSIPFTWSPVRYQQVFVGTDLPLAFTMGGLALRQNERGPIAHNITVDLEIRLGFTSRTGATMSTTFATNFDLGTPVTVVPRRTVLFPDQNATPPTNPAQFLLTIPFANTFAWVPTPGSNLLIDVTIYGNSFGNQIWGYPLDAAGGQTGRLYGSPATATTGTLEPNYGLVMSFVEQTHTAVPVLTSAETPQIGNQFPVTVDQARPGAVALLLLGASNTSFGGIPLPLDLGTVGAPGCPLLASGELMQAVAINGSGRGSFVFDIPNNIYMLGGRFYNQYLVIDPAANALGVAVSNGGVGVIGNQ